MVFCNFAHPRVYGKNFYCSGIIFFNNTKNDIVINIENILSKNAIKENKRTNLTEHFILAMIHIIVASSIDIIE